MKNLVLFAAVFLMPSLAAHAQLPVPVECQLLPVHTEGADVAFKPGVDVRGKPVVPADLNAPTMDLPKTIVIPLSVDMAGKLQASNVEGLKLDAPLGMVEIHPNGRVVYNDQDLTPNIYALCGREAVPETAPSSSTSPPSAPPAPDGQKKADVIKSDAVEIAPAKAVPPEGVMIEGGESRQEGY